MANEQQPPDDFMRLFTGKYLAAADLGKAEPTVVVERVVVEVLEHDKKKGADGKPLKEQKWIVYFRGKDKAMVFNKSNCLLMEGLTGTRNPAAWAGVAITLGVRKVQMSGEMVDGLRIIGAPSLTEPKVVTIRLRKKSPLDWELKPTGKQQRAPGQEG